MKITKSAPARRVYGGEATGQEQAKKEQANGEDEKIEHGDHTL
ncbi:MAG: hypothetical protein AB8W37_04535 [Arsenophonus endosymbiont of Dermacentor nuttalli]